MYAQPHHHTPTPAAPHKPHSPAAHHKPHQPAKPQKPAGPASHPHRQNSPLHREGRSTPRGHSSAPREDGGLIGPAEFFTVGEYGTEKVQ